MNVYVWQRVNDATDHYHSEGGAVVFADTLRRARELARDVGCTITDAELPDEIRECEGGPERVFIMPDAGCC